MNDNALAVAQPSAGLMPVMSANNFMTRYQAVIDLSNQVMKQDIDYGSIPGAGDKPSLWKPGAEKLIALFGLSPRFEPIKTVEDWTGEDHGGEPFFFYQYRCELWIGDNRVGEGIGSCNSWEKKYRYRKLGSECPSCGKELRISKGQQGRPPDPNRYWYCWKKTGGCGTEFAQSDTRIETGRMIKNPDPAEQTNTIDKMAQKRALIAAVLVTTGASALYTQDLEDLDFSDYIIDVTPEPVPPPRKVSPQKPQTIPPADDHSRPPDPVIIDVKYPSPQNNGNITLAEFAENYMKYGEHGGYYGDNIPHVVNAIKAITGDKNVGVNWAKYDQSELTAKLNERAAAKKK